MTATIRIIIGLILCITLLLMPTGIALIRQHNNFIPIFILNLLLGITGIGWVIALIWAFTSNVKQEITMKELLEALKSGKLDDLDIKKG